MLLERVDLLSSFFPAPGMIYINSLSLQYGEKHIFREINARIGNQDKIGLAGVNGAGKSTLLKMIAGLADTDPGVITRGKNDTIGYLPQEISGVDSERTLAEEAREAFAHVNARAAELEKIHRRLAESDPGADELEALLARQGELQNFLDAAGYFNIEARIARVLAGLGFREEDHGRKVSEFSGGWIMRIMLAKLLLQSPAYLLLDEPTNHLDIESVTWLESFLKDYRGAIVLVSHDRAFLDNVTTTTWELSLGRLTSYRGNYSKYLKAREERLRTLKAAYENQQAKIQQTMRFVERFRAKSTKASQVQSRLKQLEKMELIELEENEKKANFRFPPAAPGGRIAVSVEDLAAGYGREPVISGVSFDLQRGDKVAVVGVNGAGKSTLAKVLAGKLAAQRGRVRYGHNAVIGYYAQHQAAELPRGFTVLEAMTSLDTGMTISAIRSLLGAFLFRGDEVDKRIEILSGGEKSRLALARMIAVPANILIMDEPTNHLDMSSQEVLEEALAAYDGTIVLVSHNRAFADRFVNRVLEIREGCATMFEGNVSHYLEKLEARRTADADRAKKEAPQQAGARPRGREARREQARLRQKKNKALAPHKKKVKELEEKIQRLEKRKSELESVLADPELYSDQERFAELSREYSETDERLERYYHNWETAVARLEEAAAGFDPS